MGAIHKVDADHGVLSAENIGVDLSQDLPSQVVIPIAGGTLKVDLGHFVLLESRQDLFRVLFGNGVDSGKLFGQLGLGLGAKGTDPVAEL